MALTLLFLLSLATAVAASFVMAMAGDGQLFAHVANSGSGDISSFAIDPASGSLRNVGRFEIGGTISPIAADPAHRRLFVSVRSPSFAVASLAIEPGGTLRAVATTPVPASLAYLSLDATGNHLLGASYADGLACVMRVAGDSVMPEPTAIRRSGRNAHCIVLDRSNRFAFVPALGDDVVAQYLFDALTGELTPNRPPFVATGPTTGPRHLALSPDNRFAYLVTELSGEVLVFALNQETGTLAEMQRLSIMPPGSNLPPGTYEPPLNSGGGGNSPYPVIWAADVRLTPDGKFLYASERTTSIVTVFAVDRENGTLSFTGTVATERQPRALAVTPDGRYLIAAGELSNHVASYILDPVSGIPAPVDRAAAGIKPNGIAILPA